MQRFNVLLRDYGYKLEGNTLISMGIKGFTSDRIIPGRFRDAFDAASYLCPIIRDDEYTSRLTADADDTQVRRSDDFCVLCTYRGDEKLKMCGRCKAIQKTEQGLETTR